MESLHIVNALNNAISVRRVGPRAWTVMNAQGAKWLKIVNRGKAQQIAVKFLCNNPAYLKYAYHQCGRRYIPIEGVEGRSACEFKFSAPRGISHVGPFPWYSIEDGDRLLRRAARQSNRCRVAGIGTTREGREIKCLIIAPADGRRARKKAVIVAREHATETAGSFAVEEVVKHILRSEPADPHLSDFEFHVFPIVNPDGAANGRAYPQAGPAEISDMHYYGLTSNDPTCKTFREYLFSLRPECVVNYHSYMAPSVPAIIAYRKSDIMIMLDFLIHADMSTDSSWYARRQVAENKTMLHYCVRKFNTVLALFELPWTGRAEREVRDIGLRMFRSVMAAHAETR